MSNDYDVHFVVEVNDFFRTSGSSPEEAKKKLKQMINENPEFFIERLHDALKNHDELDNIKFTDVLEV